MQSILSTRCVFADSLLQMTPDSLWLSLSLLSLPLSLRCSTGRREVAESYLGNLIWWSHQRMNERLKWIDRVSERAVLSRQDRILLITALFFFTFPLNAESQVWLLELWVSFSLSFSLIHLWFVFLVRSLVPSFFRPFGRCFSSN